MERLDEVAARWRAVEPPPEDFTVLFEDFVEPQHERAYNFTVEAVNATVRADVAITVNAPGPVPVTPAEVEVSLVAPDGSPLGEPVTLDPQNPSASLVAESVNATGEYTLVAVGRGLSGNGMGAWFNATVSVAYARS